MGQGAAAIWVLLGARHGDNQQLLAIAQALGLPYRVIQLQFNAAAALAPVLLGATRLSWRTRDAEPLQAPWPPVVLAAGRRSVPAARWIQRQSSGRTRLVHVNRPWAPLSWFDVVVSTPQYALPPRDNVLVNRLPFVPGEPARAVALPASLQQHAAAMPRPWTLVMVGGNSRPYVLDGSAATALAQRVNEQVRSSGGSAWILGSPRTPATAMDRIERALEIPAQVVRWGRAENPYAALRRTADRFIVTMDSAAMLTEALLSGRPVLPFALPARPDWRWRLASTWRAAAERAPASLLARSFDALQDLGWLSSTRDVGLLVRGLEAAGVFEGQGRAPELARQERQATVTRIRRLIDAS
jgi:mitochondrial fission protein ELM1